MVAKSKKGNDYVLPDNGLLTYVQNHDRIESVRVINNTKWMIDDTIPSTFHDGDIFSPVGAHLARGENWTEVRPELPVSELMRLTLTEPENRERRPAGPGHRHRRAVRQPHHQRQPGRIREVGLSVQ